MTTPTLRQRLTGLLATAAVLGIIIGLPALFLQGRACGGIFAMHRRAQCVRNDRPLIDRKMAACLPANARARTPYACDDAVLLDRDRPRKSRGTAHS